MSTTIIIYFNSKSHAKMETLNACTPQLIPKQQKKKKKSKFKHFLHYIRHSFLFCIKMLYLNCHLEYCGIFILFLMNPSDTLQDGSFQSPKYKIQSQSIVSVTYTNRHYFTCRMIMIVPHFESYEGQCLFNTVQEGTALNGNIEEIHWQKSCS